jgi:hypothetical protein
VKNAQFTHDTTTRLRHEADERGLESSVKTARTKDMKRAKTSLEGAKGEYERLSGAAKDARRAQAGAFRKIGQAQKLRRVTRGKTAALGLTGAGLVGGAAYLHNKPKSTSWGRYSPRYRPGS